VLCDSLSAARLLSLAPTLFFIFFAGLGFVPMMCVAFVEGGRRGGGVLEVCVGGDGW